MLNLSIFSLSLLTFLLFPLHSFSQYYQPPTTQAQLVLDKQVRLGGQTTWQQNLPNTTVIGPEKNLEFQITVKNTGTQTLNTIQVADSLPVSLSYTSSRSEATFDPTTNIVKWTINQLAPGQSQLTTITARSKTASSLPTTRTLTINRACTTASPNLNSCDQASFYLGQGTAKITSPPAKLPSTGANGFGILIPGAVAALFLFFIAAGFIH